MTNNLARNSSNVGSKTHANDETDFAPAETGPATVASTTDLTWQQLAGVTASSCQKAQDKLPGCVPLTIATYI